MGAVIATPTAAVDQALGPRSWSNRPKSAAIASTPSVPATTLTSASALASDDVATRAAFASRMKTG